MLDPVQILDTTIENATGPKYIKENIIYLNLHVSPQFYSILLFFYRFFVKVQVKKTSFICGNKNRRFYGQGWLVWGRCQGFPFMFTPDFDLQLYCLTRFRILLTFAANPGALEVKIQAQLTEANLLSKRQRSR